MSHVRALWLKFHADLFAADLAAAERIRSEGCGHCTLGRLCVANYPRKARGLDDEAEQQGRYEIRLSFCCSRDGCRQRTTPPSVRFLGRHIFVASLVLLGLRTSPPSTPASAAPARQTKRRWRSFWQERLFGSAVFVERIASRMTSPLEPALMPDALLDQLPGDLLGRVLATLRLLAPWTTASVPPEWARSAMAP
jgi:hypothetical protein